MLRYRIQRVLGVGGFGRVYLAEQSSEDERFRRQVVIKVALDGDLSVDQVARLRDEARVMAALRHPHIARVEHLVQLQGRWSMVMEYIEGAQVHRLPGLSLRACLEVCAQLADAVAEIHALGMVHRDIKPANVMVTRAGQVKLLDFGIWCPEDGRADDRVDQTRLDDRGNKLLAGSLTYMAPEVFLGQTSAPRDVWAIGAVLYRLMAGEPLVRGNEGVEAMLRSVPAGRYDGWLRERVSLLADEQREILGWLLQQDPAARPTAADLAGWARDYTGPLWEQGSLRAASGAMPAQEGPAGPGVEDEWVGVEITAYSGAAPAPGVEDGPPGYRGQISERPSTGLRARAGRALHRATSFMPWNDWAHPRYRQWAHLRDSLLVPLVHPRGMGLRWLQDLALDAMAALGLAHRPRPASPR
jgi:hypothetical protein